MMDLRVKGEQREGTRMNGAKNAQKYHKHNDLFRVFLKPISNVSFSDYIAPSGMT